MPLFSKKTRRKCRSLFPTSGEAGGGWGRTDTPRKVEHEGAEVAKNGGRDETRSGRTANYVKIAWQYLLAGFGNPKRAVFHPAHVDLLLPLPMSGRQAQPCYFFLNSPASSFLKSSSGVDVVVVYMFLMSFILRITAQPFVMF